MPMGMKRKIHRRAFLAGSAMIGTGLAVSNARSTVTLHRYLGDIINMSALELSAAIKGRAVSCVEVMTSYLAHIDRYNPAVNAIILRRNHDELLAEAKARDQDLQKGIYHGWMHGFPHAVKDLADIKDIHTTLGSQIFKGHIAETDSIFVEKIRASGAIFIGKTNVPEFGLGSQSYNTVFGATGSAYDPTKTSGGSSGGAATSLALKMVPVADGSDMMGSLRNPAAFNNVIGFRPSLGRVAGDVNFYQQLACLGPMGRNVADTAKLLSTMAGYDPRSPLSLHDDPRQFALPLDKDMAGVRIGWLGNMDGYYPMEKGILELCLKSLGHFTDMGCIVEEANIDYAMNDLWQSWKNLRHWWMDGRLGLFYDNLKTRGLLKPEAIWEIENGRKLSGSDVYKATTARADFYTAITHAFERHDFLIIPTAQVFPFDKNIHWPKTVAGRDMDTYHRWMEVVVPGTMSGCPVINVPVGFNDKGLPMGMQIIGPMGKDFELLQIAYAYEQSSRWNYDYQPPALKT